eukprot:scaffold205154_cov36-Cyclotella_meneghiniana.AAC.1
MPTLRQSNNMSEVINAAAETSPSSTRPVPDESPPPPSAPAATPSPPLCSTNLSQKNDLTDDEWLVLHQIEIVLETMAEFQRTLEGEKYVTSSLVPVAVFQIRKAYVETINCPSSHPNVKKLAQTLLDDFDERYVPEDKSKGTLSYLAEDVLGKFNRYIGIHQFYFFAALLDPRVAPLLPDMLSEEDYDDLKKDVIDAMVDKAMLEKASKEKQPTPTSNTEQTSTTNETSDSTDTPAVANVSKRIGRLFRGLSTRGSSSAKNKSADDEAAIRQVCEGELSRYLIAVESGVCPLENEDGSLGDPLKWWKENAPAYAYVANVARKFLAVPATSAPSERVWSRAARVLSLKRASMKEDLVERIMFIKENMKFLSKHFSKLRKAETEVHLHHVVDIEATFFPDFDEDLKEHKIDVGANDHKLVF